MRRRWFIVGGVVLLAVVTVVGQVIPRPRRPQVSREDFSRIEKGMSREEVEAIIGGPPGDYTTRYYFPPPLGSHYIRWQTWVGDGGMILVRFDEMGRVYGTEHFEVYLLDKPSFYERVRVWLGF
jgi:hypothetical protein